MKLRRVKGVKSQIAILDKIGEISFRLFDLSLHRIICIRSPAKLGGLH